MNTILAIFGAIILTAGVVILTLILVRASIIPLPKKYEDLEESYENLYMQLGEAYRKLDAYKRMFGPIEDWQNEDMNRQFLNSPFHKLFGEEDENEKGIYLTKEEIEERYKKNTEEDDLPF